MQKLLPLLLVLITYGLTDDARATVYDATNAESDMWHSGGHNHSLWLKGLLANDDWLIDSNNPGIFDFDEGNGTASFSGSVYNENNETATAEFNFNFVVSDSGNTPKKELLQQPPPGKNAYLPTDTVGQQGGGVDTDSWTYFNFDGPGSFIGTGGDVDNLVFSLTQRGSGGVKGQFGEGANGKNIELGFSAWFYWSLTGGLDGNGAPVAFFTCPGEILKCDGHGDINIDLSPVPVPAAFWLFGTALVGFIGFSRRTTV